MVSLRSVVVAGVSAALVSAAASAQSVTFFAPLSSNPDFSFVDDTRIESRFRADANNWDSRLEFDSFPDNGEEQVGVGNGRSFFENQTFGFDLSFDAMTDEVTWSITAPGGAVTVASQDVGTFGQVNTVQIFTNGSRGSVSLTNLALPGPGVSLNDADFPSLDTDPGGPTFVETFLFLGNSYDLLSDDFSLSGDLTFGAFTRNNPSEGSKITVKLRNGFIPSPGAAATLALAGLAAVRRRR